MFFWGEENNPSLEVTHKTKSQASTAIEERTQKRKKGSKDRENEERMKPRGEDERKTGGKKGRQEKRKKRRK